MAAFTYEVAYAEARNRLTTAFRLILAIPHLLVVGVWGNLTQLLALIQWFIVVFTGKRNRGIWDLQYAYLRYYARVMGYTSLLYDPYPPFGTDPGAAPVRSHEDHEVEADRLTNGLRLIWAIPAMFVTLGLSIASAVVVVISWFAIVFTGRHPRGMFDFILDVLRYTMQFNSYVLLMTDTYPRWRDQPPALALGRAASHGDLPPPGQSFPPPVG